ncbi:hypothetical protein [Chryseobacterium sp. SIMBA_028]|uniref:hypothetical protein n=1 Tax=Chryseobacterium sp. SIMBA_028 TaxID=3085771 RepID=UPI00397C44E8
MDWRLVFHLKNTRKKLKKIKVENITYFGRAKKEVELLLSGYRCEYKNEMHRFILAETWYGKKRIISLRFKKDKVEEKYIRTEYGKISITKLLKNLSGYY